MEQNAVTKTFVKAMGVSVAAAALAMFAAGASAQEKKAATTPAPAAKAAAAAKKPAACNSLKEEAGCKVRTDCQWVGAVVDTKTKKEKRKAYCRAAPKVMAKTPEPKKPEPKKKP